MKFWLVVLVLTAIVVVDAAKVQKQKRPKSPDKDDMPEIENMLKGWKNNQRKHDVTEEKKQKFLKFAKEVKDREKGKRNNKKPGKAIGKKNKKRSKRQAGDDMCERKEFRQLTETERKNFAEKVRSLVDEGLYFLLTVFHDEANAPAAHGGPGFCCWHRFFLALLELLLGNGICLPYWASCLEYRLGYYEGWDFYQSALFGDHGLGTCQGVVNNGLFANMPVQANCTSLGNTVTRNRLPRAYNFYTEADIKEEYPSYVSHAEFSTPMNPRFETDHGAGHTMIGGHMGDLFCAPSDILFYMHHAFVDKLWEDNRGKRANAETSYPADNQLTGEYIGHRADAELKPFSDSTDPITIIDMLTNNYTDTMYTYSQSPCDIACRTDDECGSDMIWCDTYYAECIPKIRPGFPVLSDGFNNVKLSSVYCPSGQHPEVENNNGVCKANTP